MNKKNRMSSSMPTLRGHTPYLMVLVIIFLITTVGAYLLIRPINHLDWVTTAQFLRYMMRLTSPYDNPTLGMDPDLKPYHDQFENLAYSPWAVFYFGFLAYASTRLIIALSVAAWVVVVMDGGKVLNLLLVLHPLFILLWASGNLEFLVNGVGLWLILRGSKGWRAGAAIMLMAIKPQVLPFLIGLESLRALWTRDRQAILTMLLIFAVAAALFPGWPKTLYANVGKVFAIQDAPEAHFVGVPRYSFSVFGAWGVLPALGVTALILIIMAAQRRLDDWRRLAVFLSLVWTPYANPYSFVVLLVLFRKVPAWRSLLYLAIGIAALPIFFREFHVYERYGVLLYLLLAAALTGQKPKA